jgi:hypothetical protein
MLKATLFAGLLLLSPGQVLAEVPKFDSDFMQAVEDNHKSLTSNLGVQNAEGANTDAKLLEASFQEIEARFIQAGDVPDGVALATKSRNLIADILKGVSANDFPTASNASSQLGQTCKECHKLYRQD